ncbi:sodium-dependent transporter [Vallitalea okinawensis]|uniref:sodium-dependent transporter n=1 Tax=Vallitalea okinawensis TaxID=2078660 RepID=UPI000CFD48A6|nr:sodium-dependent transporter [Vallitalea okinawensis]
MSKRDKFTSKIGIIAAVAGSAIGLGNIWRFPYITGKYGGASFLIVYLICIMLVGLPVMLSEFIIGRHTGKNTVGAFKELAPGRPWFLSGWLGLFASVITLGFYSVVAGWGVKYIIMSLFNNFSGKDISNLGIAFDDFVTSGLDPVFWQLLFILFTGAIVVLGVKNGIEKFSKILMPIFFILLCILVVNAFTLEGAKEGLAFLFKPDFNQLTMEAIFVALGHSFFTLSLGMGTMITYGSYISKEEDLTKTALQVIVADTGVAILAGVAIFPAVFTFGIDPGEGAGLAFVTLPAIFTNIPFGYILSILFFFLLTIAALTSAISMLEVPVAFLEEETKLSRNQGTLLICLAAGIFGLLCSLSNGAVNITVMGQSLMSFAEYLSSNILLPFVGLLTAIFVGWALQKRVIASELKLKQESTAYNVFMGILKFITPIAIIFVFLYSIGVISF